MLPQYSIGDTDDGIRVHIIKRLYRLCSVPESRLADFAKQTLKEVLVFKEEPRVTCFCSSTPTAPIAEGLQSKTGLSRVVTVDTIPAQPRFYALHDIGTGPLYGDSVQSTDTTAVIEAACCEVCFGDRVLH